MIIYGSKGNIITLARTEVKYCHECKCDRDFCISMVYRYGHVFWIPMFSWSTKFYYHCSVCKAGYEIKSGDIKPYITQNPKPIFHRFGWLIPVVGILILILTS